VTGVQTGALPICLAVEAASNSLRPALSGWANQTDNIQDWYREG